MTDAKAAEKEKKKREKPVYGVFSCIGFMMKLAAKYEPMVITGGLFLVLLSSAGEMIELFLSPTVIGAVERRESVPAVIITVLGFIGSLFLVRAAERYISKVDQYRKIQIRLACVALINTKCAVTSYSNMLDEDFLRAKNVAREATGNNSSSTESIWRSLRGIVSSVISFAVYVVLMTRVNPFVLLIMLATTIPGYFTDRIANRWGDKRRVEKADIERGLHCAVSPASEIRAAKDIRIFGMKPWFEEMYRKYTRLIISFRMKEETVRIWADLISLIMAFVRNGIPYVYLIGSVVRGDISAAEFLLLFSAVNGFTSKVGTIISQAAEIKNNCTEISRLRECLDYKEPFLFEGGKEPSDGVPEIKLEDVSFRYPGSDKDVISHVSFTIPKGEKLAVVGLNGAGKTTLVKLICGLLDPTEGRITCDGEDVRVLNRRLYYEKFSAIFQDHHTIPGSIEENIAPDEEKIDQKRIDRCISDAGLSDKIASLPDGEKTKLNRQVYYDAVELSGGEQQKMMLARALYKKSDVLILDEPTAALDPIAESELYEKYEELARSKSAVFISHRLASTKFCDRIILLENGSVAEAGAHSELLASGGSYARLFETQSRYYKDGAREAEGGDGNEE